MFGGRLSVTATSSAQEMCVLWVVIKISEKTASAMADGLKMCARRPSLFHVINSLHSTPVDTSRNCRKNQSSLNHRNRFVLRTMGTGPKPRIHLSRLHQQTSMSSA